MFKTFIKSIRQKKLLILNHHRLKSDIQGAKQTVRRRLTVIHLFFILTFYQLIGLTTTPFHPVTKELLPGFRGACLCADRSRTRTERIDDFLLDSASAGNYTFRHFSAGTATGCGPEQTSSCPHERRHNKYKSKKHMIRLAPFLSFSSCFLASEISAQTTPVPSSSPEN